MAGWRKFELKLPDIPTGDLTSIINKLKEFIEILVKILDVILTIASTALDPVASAIKALIAAIKEIIESYLDDAGGYLLYVPIRKRFMTNFLGFGDVTPSWAGDNFIFQQPYSQVDIDDPIVAEFITNMNRYNGGNVGFYNTVMESLYDEGDLSRPQFTSDNDYIGGMAIVMGTDFDPLGFLDDIWRLFGLFNLPDSTPKLPRPKNLRGRAITKVQGDAFSVLLRWDPVDVPVVRLEDLGGTVYYPTRYAIIRAKNDVRVTAASNVIDLVGTRDLTVGTTFAGTTEVIAEGELDLTSVSYVDHDIPAAEEDAFYYAIAWKLSAYGQDQTLENSEGVTMGYWNISNVIRVVPFPTIPSSTPPNWYRTPSIASMFPPFADLLRRIVMELENYADKVLGPIDQLKMYVDFLRSEITRYEALVNEILAEIAKIKALADLPTAGIYIRTFKGKGGNTFFITDLANSLLPNYPNAPPFHRGDEYVTGVILLTGGNLPEVEAFISTLEFFFGGSYSSELSDLVSKLGQQVSESESLTFGPDLQSTTTQTTEQFDCALCPLNTCTNPQIAPESVTFGPDFSIVTGG